MELGDLETRGAITEVHEPQMSTPIKGCGDEAAPHGTTVSLGSLPEARKERSKRPQCQVPGDNTLRQYSVGQQDVPSPAAAALDGCQRPFPGARGEPNIVLVDKFGSAPATYSLPVSDIRLHVRRGCFQEGQVAGPITIRVDKEYLVTCGGLCFLVSEVVDCQPSGTKFDMPLLLDLRVEETLDEDNDNGEDSGLENELAIEERNEYMSGLRDTYKFLVREESGDAWSLLGDEKTTVVYEHGRFFIRAPIDHFSQGCLAKTIQLESAYHEQLVTRGRPQKMELEFVNATDTPLIFLVLPTSWSNQAILSVAMSVGFEGIEANLAITRAIEQCILPEATQPQVVQVPCKKEKGDPRVGQICPFATCRLPNSTGSEARVALITANSETVSVWDYRIVPQRTRLVVLPGQFSDGMLPVLGTHKRDEFAQDTLCLMNIALMAMMKGLQISERSPVSTISSGSAAATTMKCAAMENNEEDAT